VAGTEVWTKAVISSLGGLPKASTGPCILNATFVLPEDKYPRDHPFGSDLDNLCKRLFDALGATILSEVPGKDGAIVEAQVRKRRAAPSEKTGVWLQLYELPG